MKNIFISSTFRDMQAERDLVQKRVLPELRDKARKYGENVGVIDLRWGVDTSELETDEGSRKVLSVCLDEIERSHPYMLIFMGERYGWIPEPKMIESAVEGKADKLVMDDYEKSITALEIEFGALSEKYGELDKCVVCMRSSLGHLIVDENERKMYLEENPKAAEKLRRLQERMREKLGNRIIEYTADWSEAEKVFKNFRTIGGQALEEAISKAYLMLFEKDWEAFANFTWQQREQLEVQAVMESKLKSFRGREKLLAQYRRQLEENNVLILQGEVGSGKTSILCKLMQILEEEGKKVFRFISGNTVNSSCVFELLKQMVWFMEKVLGVEEHFKDAGTEKEQNIWNMENETKKQSKYDEWKEYFVSLCFRLTKESEVYFCIDALDQLLKDEHLEKLDFLTGNRENIHFVASCTTEFELPLAFVEKGKCVEAVPLLSVEDSMEVIEGLSMASSRNVYARIRTAMLEKKDAGNPLYLSFMMQRLNMMDQEDLRDAVGEEEIVATGVRVLQEVPDRLEEAAVYVLEEAMERLSSEGETLREILNLLATSRNGLRKEDLDYLLSERGKAYPALDMSRMMKYLEGFFVLCSDGRIDFGHKVFRKGLREKILDIKSWQKKILDYLNLLQDDDMLKIHEGMYYARKLGNIEFAEQLICIYQSKEGEALGKAIALEAVADEGEFYSILVEKLYTSTEYEKRNNIVEFFLYNFSDILKQVPNSVKTKEKCLEKISWLCEKIYQCEKTLLNVRNLLYSYALLGEHNKKELNIQQAEKYALKALKYAEQFYEENECLKSKTAVAECRGLLGDVLFRQNKIKEAKQHFLLGLKYNEELYESTKRPKYLRYAAQISRILAKLCIKQRRYDEAEQYLVIIDKYLQSICKKNQKCENQKELILCFHMMGEVYELEKKYSEAIECFEMALEFSQSLVETESTIENIRLLSDSYRKIGRIYQLRHEYDVAEKFYIRMQEYLEMIYSKNKDCCHAFLGMFICNLLMAELYFSRKDYETASQYGIKAMEYSELLTRNGIWNHTAWNCLMLSYRTMGEISKAQKRYEEAEVYFENELEYSIKNNERYGESLKEVAISYLHLGEICGQCKKILKANGYYLKSVECIEKIYGKEHNEELFAYMMVGCISAATIFEKEEQFEEAKVYYEKAMYYLQKTGIKSAKHKRSYATIIEKLGEISRALGDYDGMAEYYRLQMFVEREEAKKEEKFLGKSDVQVESKEEVEEKREETSGSLFGKLKSFFQKKKSNK